MKLKKVVTLTIEEAAEHAALRKEAEELKYLIAKLNLKDQDFNAALVAKYGINQGIYTIRKRGIYTEG